VKVRDPERQKEQDDAWSAEENKQIETTTLRRRLAMTFFPL
jgi:hypothetical protein